eukprot:4581816-Prymnesium_polylepis.1
MEGTPTSHVSMQLRTSRSMRALIRGVPQSAAPATPLAAPCSHRGLVCCSTALADRRISGDHFCLQLPPTFGQLLGRSDSEAVG